MRSGMREQDLLATLGAFGTANKEPLVGLIEVVADDNVHTGETLAQ